MTGRLQGPTLPDLQAQLEEAIGVQISAVANLEWAELEGAVTTVFEEAVAKASDDANIVVFHITELPASNMADLAAKAFALRWLHAKVQGVARFSLEHRLAEQLVTGLLKERIS